MEKPAVQTPNNDFFVIVIVVAAFTFLICQLFKKSKTPLSSKGPRPYALITLTKIEFNHLNSLFDSESERIDINSKPIIENIKEKFNKWWYDYFEITMVHKFDEQEMHALISFLRNLLDYHQGHTIGRRGVSRDTKTPFLTGRFTQQILDKFEASELERIRG